MGQFPDADHLGSWAGMAPGNHESAGKRKSGKTRKGSRWLRTTLVVAAQAAGCSKDTVLLGGVPDGQDQSAGPSTLFRRANLLVAWANDSVPL
jgi:hypothetical protein